MALVALVVVCVLTYSFEIVFGLGGTILMLPLLALWFDAKTLVIYSTLPQILVGTIGLIRSPKTVEPKFLAGMLLFAAAGSAVGLTLFYYLPAHWFQYALAVGVTAAGVYLLAAPGRRRLPSPLARALDTLAGVSQALFGISGPIAMTRLLATFADKTVVRNYALAFFLALNLLRAGGYAINGTFTPQIGWMMLVSAPPLALTLWAVNHWHHRVNDTVFRRTVAWLVVIGGVSLFYR